jgi:hypothetical protein
MEKAAKAVQAADLNLLMLKVSLADVGHELARIRATVHGKAKRDAVRGS